MHQQNALSEKDVDSIYGGVLTSLSMTTTESLMNKMEDAVFAGVLQRLVNLSPWIMTTGRDSSGDYYVSFVIREFLEPVTLKSSSRRLLMLQILLHVGLLEEMLLHLAGHPRSDGRPTGFQGGRRSD